MFSVSDQVQQCSECHDRNEQTGWFICQECHRIFCSDHSIVHRHHEKTDRLISERYNRYVHLDQIAEWERKAIEKIRKQADEARRPLIAPPTPISPDQSPTTNLINQLRSTSLTRLFNSSSSIEKPSPIIDPYELLSDETLDELIGDGSLTIPPGDRSTPGRISFSSQFPYLNGVHSVRLSIDQFVSPTSWAFVGIVSNETRLETRSFLNRSSFGWHLGRKSIIYDRRTSTLYDYDGENIRQGDTFHIYIDCDAKTIRLKNERTRDSHTISINRDLCPLPWFFAVNFNYENKDSMRLLS